MYRLKIVLKEYGFKNNEINFISDKINLIRLCIIDTTNYGKNKQIVKDLRSMLQDSVPTEFKYEIKSLNVNFVIVTYWR